MSITNLVAALPEIYQPIYGHPELSERVSRQSADRLETIVGVYRALELHLHRAPRVLDLGCAQGYFCLALGALGADVTGIDNLQANIDVCQALAREHPEQKPRFQVCDIEGYLQQIAADQFDVVLGLSVFHHLVHQHGVDTVAGWLDILAKKTACSIVELALRDEPLYWAAAQPADERELLCHFAFAIELGRYPTHLSEIARPLLFASNQLWYVDGKVHPFDRHSKQSHAFAGNAHAGTRSYYFSHGQLAKHYRLVEPLILPNRKEFDVEIALLANRPKKLAFLPKLLAHSKSEHDLMLVREALKGELLLNLMLEGKHYAAEKIIGDVLQQLSALESLGLFHSDVRAWNVLIEDDGGAFLIDYGSISRDREDCVWPQDLILSFFIFVHEVATGKCEPPIPQRQPFISPFNLPEPYLRWAREVWKLPKPKWTFAQLRKLWKATLKGTVSMSSNTGTEQWMAEIERNLDHLNTRSRQIESEIRSREDSVQNAMKETLSLIQTQTAREKESTEIILRLQEEIARLSATLAARERDLGAQIRAGQEETKRMSLHFMARERELGAQIIQGQKEVARLASTLAKREQGVADQLRVNQAETHRTAQMFATQKQELEAEIVKGQKEIDRLVRKLAERETDLGAQVIHETKEIARLTDKLLAREQELGTQVAQGQKEIDRLAQMVVEREKEFDARIAQSQKEIDHLARALAEREEDLCAQAIQGQREATQLADKLVAQEKELGVQLRANQSETQRIAQMLATKDQALRVQVFQRQKEVEHLTRAFADQRGKIDVILETIQGELTIAAKDFAAIVEPAFQTSKNGRYRASELTRFNDEAFVRAAYQALLRRAPDPTGFKFYLDRLRTGAAKDQILGEIRSSKEGKLVGADVSGITVPYTLQRVSALPLLGPGARLLLSLWHLPAQKASNTLLERKISQINSRLHRFIEKTGDIIRMQPAHAAEHLADRNEDGHEGKSSGLDVAPTSILSQPIVLGAESANEILAILSARLGQSQEAHKLSLGRS
jgi:O-antigen chain-terminating methyltransferase